MRRACWCPGHNGQRLEHRTWKRCPNRQEAPEAPLREEEEEEEELQEEEEEVEDKDAIAFSNEIFDVVNRGNATVTGVEAILKIVSKNYQKYLPAGFTIPSSWYMVRKHVNSQQEKPR